MDLCTSDGLASVTGTVLVGAETTSAPRSSATSAANSTGKATYSLATLSITGIVASLAVPTTTASSAVAAASSSVVSAAATGLATNGTTPARTAGAGRGAVPLAAFVGAALLALA